MYSQKSDHNNSALLLIIFIIWPFLGFLFAIYDFKRRFSRFLILLFFLIFGFLIYLNPQQDSQRRADYLKAAYLEPFDKFFDSFDKLYEESLDFIEPLLIYTVSRFTDFYGTLFAIYALIFGSLMLYYLKIMYLHFYNFKNINALIFLILLVFVNSIGEINGFRMWTAAWIFAVGMILFFHFQKDKYLLFACSAIFLHFSYIPLVILVFVYKFFGNRAFIYGSLAIFSFFVAELNIDQVQQYAAFFGKASETKISAYTGDKYIESVNNKKEVAAWFLIFNERGMHYFTSISMLMVYLKKRAYFRVKLVDNFYSFTLLLLTFANISSLLPSGARFYRVYNIFAFSTLLLYYVYEEKDKKISNINLFALPVIVLFVFFNIRLFSEPASIYLLGPSCFMPFALYENISLSILF